MYYMDSSILLLIPAFLLALWAQFNIKSTFGKYSKIRTIKGTTAEEVARLLLARAGLQSVLVNKVPGNLTDHYDPVKRIINLSDAVYGSSSIASLGVAAHECGHAIQHQIKYSPLMIRNTIVPAVNLGSTLAIPLFFIGFLINTPELMTLGIILFTGVIVFHLVTLPVEFDASARAISVLSSTGSLSQNELTGASAVLRAAAWTYIAAAVMAIVQLLRLIILKGQNR